MTGMKLVAVVGPTASGKTDLAIGLARKFNGEIISADSRQVYRGLDLGSGKAGKKQRRLVPHHLIDVASPKRRFTVAQFKRLAEKKLRDISGKGRLPIIAGGSAFYVYSVIDSLDLPQAKPDARLRRELDKKTAAQLFAELKKSDPVRAETIDKNNKVRLVRALEIIYATGQPVPPVQPKPNGSALIIGIKLPPGKLKQNIGKRLRARLKLGLVAEVKKLRRQGLAYKRLEDLGLEYRYIALYLQEKISYREMVDQLERAIGRFAKRQMTWFKKDPRINWVANSRQAKQLVKQYLKNKKPPR